MERGLVFFVGCGALSADVAGVGVGGGGGCSLLLARVRVFARE
jgi:hypothetical protein